jgi:hypothetical protein
MVDSNFVRLLISLSLLYQCVSMLEALWSRKEIFQYIIFACGVSGLVLGVVHLLKHGSTPCTSFPLLLTLLVGVRHAFPLKELVDLTKHIPSGLHAFLPARGLIQVRHVPFLALLFELLGASVFPSYSTQWPVTLSAYLASWFYIRYLMHFPYANVRGDHSSEFNLSLLFPRWSRWALDPLFDSLFSVVTRCLPFLHLRVADKTSVMYSPGRDERKTQALKILDDKIRALGRGLTPEEVAEV